MLSAVYYPHTAIRDENFLKHALLYWDEIEYISPWEHFDPLPRYVQPAMAELSSFLKPKVPSDAEKKRAHAEIMNLIDGDLPSWLKVDHTAEAGDSDLYYLFRDKLLPETWEELKSCGMAKFSRHGDLDDYVSHTYLGLTLMAILARVCAGTVKHTITDRSDAYSSFLKHLEYLSGADSDGAGPLDPQSRKTFQRWLEILTVRRAQQKDEERRKLVSIALDVIDAGSLSVGALVSLRSDRAALASQLRQNYAKSVEEYVDNLSQPDLAEGDVLSMREDFRRKMTQDLEILTKELSGLAWKTALSKEVAVALVATTLGSTVLTSTGVGAPLGGALAIGALGKLHVEYRTARDDTLSKHPMAFMYSAKRFQLV